MTDSTSCTAPFAKAITLEKITGTIKGAVSINPSGKVCQEDCSQVFPKVTTVTLTAQPPEEALFILEKWVGDCQEIASKSLKAQVFMDKDPKNCTGQFGQVNPASLNGNDSAGP